MNGTLRSRYCAQIVQSGCALLEHDSAASLPRLYKLGSAAALAQPLSSYMKYVLRNIFL